MFLDFQEVRDIIAYYLFLVFLYSISGYFLHDIRYPLWLGIIILTLPVLLPDESKIRRFVCFSVYFIVSLFSSVFFLFYFSFSPCHPQNIRSLERVEAFLSSIFGLKIELRGIENLSKYRRAIIVMNHQSVLDILVLVRLWKWLGSPRVLAKREIFYFWPVGLTTWLCGVIFVEKMTGRRGWIHFIKQASQHLDSAFEKPCIVMFPEAKRNPDKTTLLPFRKGAFTLAVDMNLTIVPIVISPYHFLDSKHLRRGRIIVTIMNPITKDVIKSTANPDEILQKTWTMMDQQFKAPVS